MPRVSFVECVGKEKAELIKKRSPALYSNLVYQFDHSQIGYPSNEKFREAFKDYIDDIIAKYDLEVEGSKKLDLVFMIRRLFNAINLGIDKGSTIDYYFNDVKHCIMMNNPNVGTYGFVGITCKIREEKDLYIGTNDFGQVVFSTINKDTLFANKDYAKMTGIIANAILTAYCTTSENDNWVNHGGY